MKANLSKLAFNVLVAYLGQYKDLVSLKGVAVVFKDDQLILVKDFNKLVCTAEGLSDFVCKSLKALTGLDFTWFEVADTLAVRKVLNI